MVKNSKSHEHHSGIRRAANVQLSITDSGASTPPGDLSTSYPFIISEEREVERGTAVTFYFPAQASLN
jgi:hypothetical protein